MKKITGFSVMTTGEGKRITVNYSVLDEEGNLKDTNLRENYVELDENVLEEIKVMDD